MREAEQVTVSYVYKDGKILLGLCKRGLSKGKWNGFGGHQESAETIEQTAKREFFEESGARAVAIEKRGLLKITNTSHGEIELHIFRVLEYEGVPQETDEMSPRWFQCDKVPYKNMWPNDRIHLPLLLSDELFTGYFYLDDGRKILEYSIKKVSELN
jgi:8-oxo-dGTP diphosphatase